MAKQHVSGIIIVLSVFLVVGCMSAAQHQRNLHSSQERELTAGIVQKEIRIGMSPADVAAALGSPNIVTRDSDGKETWIFDKIATEASYSSGSGGVGLGAAGGGVPGSTLLLGIGSAGYRGRSGASSTTQKTLTVIIKFAANAVDSFSFHTSKF